LRLMADIEPLSSVRRHLRWLAKEHDEVAESIRAPRDPALPYSHDAELT
jgi:hypothetical protein